MDISNLKRDPSYIRGFLKELKDGSTIFTKEAILTVPKKWSEGDLVNIGKNVNIVTIFAIIIDDKYAVSTVNSMMETIPDKILSEKIEDEDYILFKYGVNDIFMLNRSLVKRDNLPYKLFTFIFDKGKIPWFLDYVDISQIFDTSSEFASVKFNLPHTVFEMVTGAIARDVGNKYSYYRHADWKKKPVYIPLRSVQFAASNTTAKLIGAYWEEGLSSALVYPSERKELIEELLRS